MLYHVIDALMLFYVGNLHGNLRISRIILPSLCCRIWSLRLFMFLQLSCCVISGFHRE